MNLVQKSHLQIVRLPILFLLLLIALPVTAEVYPVEHVGNLRIFGDADKATRAVVLVSGLTGWNDEMEKIAVLLSSRNILVGGLDLKEYLLQERKSKLCPASDLDDFGKILEKRAGMKHYRHALLVGYREGGNLTMMANAEAPGIFAGAVSLGFCTDFPVPLENTCGGEKLFSARQPISFQRPWVLIQGIGESCSSEDIAAFLKNIPYARVIHATADWKDQLQAEVQEWSAEPPTSKLSDLPLIEYESEKNNSTLMIFFSGDGGWGELEDEMSRYYQQKGIASVGIDSLRYFWDAPDPSQAGKDLGRVIVQYANVWKRSDVILMGYSYGADVIPFLVNRLPQEALQKLRGIALIGPSLRIDFDISPALVPRNPELPLMPEIKRIGATPLLCIGGIREKQSLCRRLNQKMTVSDADVEMLQVGHAFGSAYTRIADLILNKLL